MKKIKLVLSFLLALVLLVTNTIVFSSAETIYDKYGYYYELEKRVNNASDDLGFTMDDLKFDIVDGAQYAYTVKDGEATIFNVRTNFVGPEKSVFTFATHLGGYPVTAIGNSGCSVIVFEYLQYPGEIDPENYIDRAEMDPGLNYVSKIVIPEGYETIYESAFMLVWGDKQFSFPKSLRNIEQYAFEEFYTHIDPKTGGKYAVLPECNVSAKLAATSICENIVTPSRVTGNISSLIEHFRGYKKSFYIPSNLTYKNIFDCFYYFEAAAGDNGEIWPISGTNMTLHCAPDSEFLQVFEDYSKPKNLTIITDVTPAEYIAFPLDTVNVNVGEVVDLEAKTYPTDAIWTACGYTVSDPSIVKIDEYSGRITALKEGTVTVTATHCERGYVDTCTVNVTTKPEPGVNGIEPATDTPYVTYGNRDYKINVTGSPSKIQVVRDNGGTTTIDRRKAQVTSNGDTETWIVNMRVEAGTHNIRAKYGKVWEERLTPFTVKYDLPGAYSFDLTYENGMGNFDVVTDPEVIKIQFALDNGCTLTYSQVYSYIGEDGLRHWEISRKLPTDIRYTLKTKYGYTWTTTEFTVTT